MLFITDFKKISVKNTSKQKQQYFWFVFLYLISLVAMGLVFGLLHGLIALLKLIG